MVMIFSKLLFHQLVLLMYVRILSYKDYFEESFEEINNLGVVNTN